jgi:hypothetical protein
MSHLVLTAAVWPKENRRPFPKKRTAAMLSDSVLPFKNDCTRFISLNDKDMC